jgi:hypothetical protein
MRGNSLIVVGVLLIAAGITFLVHPQWQGRDKKVEVEVGTKQLEVNTRRVTDFPPLFSGAILVMGICVTALGGISRTKAKPSTK